MVGTPLGPLFLFFLPFFSRFLSFFLLFIFSFFSLLSISSFFDFLMFFIFHFPKEKLSSFLFSCISFKYFLLLALVSEFNYFLRDRCSMEMWCPDDIGRDSWDWVGPPAWVRACFNSPEWGGGSSPVKTEPLQTVLLLLWLFLTRAFGQSVFCQQTLRINWPEKCALSAKNAPHHAGSSTSTRRNNVCTRRANSACKDSNRSIN